MLLSAESDWQESHQQHHFQLDSNRCEICHSPQLADEWTTVNLPSGQLQLKNHNQLLVDLLERISTVFLQTIDRHLQILRSIDSVMDIVDLSWRLLGNQHSFRGSPSNVNRLFSLAMATLLKTNNALKENYPGIWNIVQSNTERNSLNQFHQLLLDTILSRNLQTFTDTMKTTFLDALNNWSNAFREPNQVAVSFLVMLYGLISVTEMYETIIKLDLKKKVLQESVASILPQLVCALSNDYFVVYSITTFETKLQCNVCCPKNDRSLPKDLLFVNKSHQYAQNMTCENIIQRLLESLTQTDSTTVRLSVINALPFVAKHIPDAFTNATSKINMKSFIVDSSIEVLQNLAVVLPDVLTSINSSIKISTTQWNRFYDKLFVCISTAVQESLSRSDGSRQAAVIKLIRAIGCQPGLSEHRVLQTFLLTIFFITRPESLESKNAALCAVEICFSASTNPRQLVCWYKEDVFKLLVAGAVNNFMRHGYGLNKSLTNVSIY